MSKTVHSIKLQAYNSVDLDRLSYSNGDMVYDLTNGTVRLMDGITNGGKQLLRADLSNVSAGAILSVTSIIASGTISAATLVGSISSLQVTSALAYTPVSPTVLTTTLNGYVTSSSLTTTLNGYVTSSSLTTTLNGYATTSSVAFKAPLASPTFTGIVTAPTVIVGGVNIKTLAIAMGAALS
jgi:hypothetical protein